MLLDSCRAVADLGRGLHVYEEALPAGQQVVDHDLDPPAEPEPEVEYSRVLLVLGEALGEGAGPRELVRRGVGYCSGV